MSTSVNYVGNSYSVPAYGDTGYAQGAGNLSSYLVALATGSLTLSGGTFTLTADANFGASFGLVALYLKSVTANIASAGFLRLANTDTIGWRNAANSADLLLAVSGTNILTFASNAIAQAAGTGITLNTTTGAVSITAPVTVALGGTNSVAALANGKLMASAGGAVIEVNADSSMNSHKITNLSNGSAATDAAAFGQIPTYSACAAYTPTFAGFGTATNVSFFWYQVGDTIFIRGTLKTATTAASTASFTIPSGKTIDTTKIPSATANTAMSGMFVTNSASAYITANFMGIVFSDGSTTDKLFFALTGSAGAGASKGNGNAVSQDNSYIMLFASIPVV